MKMSITTKTGDRGTTRLFSGEEVSKDSSRPNAYGDLDELVSILGVARCHCPDADTQQAILNLQRDLFVAGSEMATAPGGLERLGQRIDAARLADLERLMTELEEAIEIPNGFIVPGGTPVGAACRWHVRRRRAGQRQPHCLAQPPVRLSVSSCPQCRG